ncbi:MAG: hypothetical protein KC619_04860 [Myxococcales bacterium]|nr:hypothetical protein [Myxococcales bacterium]
MIEQLGALGISEPELWALLGLVLAASVGAGSAWYFLRGSWWPVRLFAAMSVGSALGVASLTVQPIAVDAELDRPLPARVRDGGYASSDTCRSCHPGQYASWHRSFHRTMTQVATPTAVRAPFAGQVLTERGRSFQLARRGDGFYVREVPQPVPMEIDEAFFEHAARIVMSTGSHHMQAYWYESAEGRLEQLPFVYLMREDRWLANSDSFLEPPHDEGDALVRYTWSDSCVTCHSTGGPWDDTAAQAARPDRTPEMQVAELGISCEACHGPGEAHVEANGSPARRYAQRQKETGDPTIVNPARLTHERSASVCGRCHSVHPDGQGVRVHEFRPGEMLDEYLSFGPMFQVVDEANEVQDLDWLPYDERDTVGSFWTDGSVRVAGREHTGMIRSGCYLAGEMDCTSCHSMHEADPDRQIQGPHDADAMCTECHADHALDPEAHTHHPVASAGGRCVSCHMPYSAYALLMATRSHQMDGPTATGQGGRARPNACNLCHLDRSIGWSAVYLSRWYGQRSPTTAERTDELPAGVYWMMRGDATQRAVAAWHMGWEPARAASDLGGQLREALQSLLADPYPAVRQVAATSLARIDPDVQLDREAIAADAITWEPTDPVLAALRRERDDTPVAIPE